MSEGANSRSGGANSRFKATNFLWGRFEGANSSFNRNSEKVSMIGPSELPLSLKELILLYAREPTLGLILFKGVNFTPERANPSVNPTQKR